MAIKNNEGLWMDSQGDFIPARYIQPLDKKKDRVVTKLANRAKKLNEQLKKFKEEVFQDVEKYIEAAKESYDIDIKTDEGNKTLTDFSNAYKVEVRVRKQLAFDEKLELAKALIDECIKEWSRGANDKLVLLIEQAFRVDKAGFVDRDKILNLRKLKIKDEKWQKAMTIIGDSLTVTSKKAYVRFMEKVDGRWETVALDISKI